MPFDSPARLVAGAGQHGSAGFALAAPMVHSRPASLPSWGEMLEADESVEELQTWTRHGVSHRCTRWIARQIMHVCARLWFRFEIRGAENLPPGGFLLACNHASHFDTVAVLHALGRRGHELSILGARDYFFNNRFKTWFFTTFFRVLPFERHGECRAGLYLANEVLKAGRPLLIFPEGTRSPNGELQSFRPGVGLMGLELGVPIVPCRVDGTFACLPKGKWWPRRSQVRVTFGSPVPVWPYRALERHLSRGRLYRRLADDLRQGVAVLEHERAASRQ